MCLILSYWCVGVLNVKANSGCTDLWSVCLWKLLEWTLKWPCLTFLECCVNSNCWLNYPGRILGHVKNIITCEKNSKLVKWKVLWVYLVLHWLVKKSPGKMGGTLDAEFLQEIQHLLSWMKAPSSLPSVHFHHLGPFTLMSPSSSHPGPSTLGFWDRPVS